MKRITLIIPLLIVISMFTMLMTAPVEAENNQQTPTSNAPNHPTPTPVLTSTHPTNTPTVTPIPPTATITSTATPTPFPTYTPLPTYTPYPTHTPYATNTPTPIVIVVTLVAPPPTYTPFPSPTSTVYPTYTPLPTYTPFPSPTGTVYPTYTPLPTYTPFPIPVTATPRRIVYPPTPTPMPSTLFTLRVEVFTDADHDDAIDIGEGVEEMMVMVSALDGSYEATGYTEKGIYLLAVEHDQPATGWQVSIPYLQQTTTLSPTTSIAITQFPLIPPVLPIQLP